MDQLLVWTTVISLGFLLGAVRSYIRYREARQRLRSFLAQWKETNSVSRSSWSVRRLNLLLNWAERCSSLGMRFPFPDSPEEAEVQLNRSGRPFNLTVKRFLGLKIVLAGIGLGIGVSGYAAGLPLSQFGLLVFPLTGFFAPVIWLRKYARNRQETISRDMPDFLDIMSMTLQAGASLDQAMRQVSGLFKGPLHDEIERFNREIELGVERGQAWFRLLERNSAPELQKLVNAILQAGRLGVPIAAIFRLQAGDMRRLRIERVKEKAAKASPKITTVTTVLIAPAVFVMILGLIVLNVFYNPEGLGVDGLFQ